ncbi:NAD-P-binding protein, partial [Trametes meyenii]
IVTGSSSGFGREAVVQLLDAGDKVIATLRKPEVLVDLVEKYSASRLRVIKLDVTKPEEIKAAFAEAKAAFGRIDVVFNNAGYFAIGEAEVFQDDVARPLFEVNFWGAVHVAQEAVRFFREENKPQGGLLLQNSSTSGIYGVPVTSFYAATKHALEGWTEALSKEVNPAWNIKITIIEPGAFKTSVFDKNMIVIPVHPAYDEPTLPVYHMRRGFLRSAGKQVDMAADLNEQDPAKAIAKIIELSKVPSPPLRFAIGTNSVLAIREKIKQVGQELDTYESWSQSL